MARREGRVAGARFHSVERTRHDAVGVPDGRPKDAEVTFAGSPALGEEASKNVSNRNTLVADETKRMPELAVRLLVLDDPLKSCG